MNPKMISFSLFFHVLRVCFCWYIKTLAVHNALLFMVHTHSSYHRYGLFHWFAIFPESLFSHKPFQTTARLLWLQGRMPERFSVVALSVLHTGNIFELCA